MHLRLPGVRGAQLTSLSWPRGRGTRKGQLYNALYCCSHVKIIEVQLWEDWEYYALRSAEEMHGPLRTQSIKDSRNHFKSANVHHD